MNIAEGGEVHFEKKVYVSTEHKNFCGVVLQGLDKYKLPIIHVIVNCQLIYFRFSLRILFLEKHVLSSVKWWGGCTEHN